MRHAAAALMLLGASLLFGQTADTGDELVTVPKKYVSAEGLAHQAASPEASKWIGIGREIGIATREGLNAVVDSAEKFGSTRVGTFVMVMVAWKIIGHDVLGVVLGIPFLIAGALFWLWIFRRLFIGYKVVTKKDGVWSRQYADHPPYKFETSDAKTAAAVTMVVSGIVYVLLMCLLIFGAFS